MTGRLKFDIGQGYILYLVVNIFINFAGFENPEVKFLVQVCIKVTKAKVHLDHTGEGRSKIPK